MIKVIRQKFKDLGPMTFHEAAVLVLFIICVLLWFFRDPGFIPGWSQFFGNARNVDDATAVMLIVLLLFAIPSKPTFWCFRRKEETLGMCIRYNIRYLYLSLFRCIIYNERIPTTFLF